MKKLMVAGGALAVFACMGAAPTAISVPAGETVKVGAGCKFEGGVLVKTGAGTLDLSAAVLRNEGLEIREGAVLFASGGSAVVSCRYLRWNVTKTRPAKSAPPEYGNTGSQFSEFRLFRGGKMLPRPAHATAICANDWAESPKKGIDGDLKTKCYANPFVADFGEEVTFDGYSFATANDAIGRDPMSWTVEAGVSDGSAVGWLSIGAVEGFEAPKARHAEAGKIFPVKLRDAVPLNYPVKVCGKGRLVLRGVNETLERVTGTGHIVLEGASLDVGPDAAFAGTVSGDGAVVYKKR